jgi:L-asparaginase II
MRAKDSIIADRTPSAFSCQPAVIAEVYRGRHVESRHFGHIAVVDVTGRLVFAVGDPERLIFPRSALKPLQALAGVVSGTDRRFQFIDAELAVSCGSHRAERRQLAAVQSILDKVGATERDLRCGPQPVADIATREDLIRAGQAPTAIHNNCSGKHAHMLALAQILAAPLDGYWNIDHPVQQRVQQICCDLCCDDGVGSLEWATDGCGVPTYLFTLRQLARSFALFGTPDSLEAAFASACCRISAAMMAEPDMVGGADVLDSVLMRQLPGVVVAKGGAEGVQAMAIVGRGIGVAIKIEDGNGRPLWPVCLAILQRLDVLPEPLPADFMEARQAEIKDTRGSRVGSVRVCF